MHAPPHSARPSLASVLLAVALALVVAPRALANPLPPNPVLGQPADYVIVTPSAFATEFQALAKFKTRSGVPALVKTLESIRAEYPTGRDDAERVRLFLQDAKNQWNTHWALLGGLPPDLPARRVNFPNFGDFPTDLYFGALHAEWDPGIADPGDSADLRIDVFVGRAPVRSDKEARDFVSKTILATAEPYTPVPHLALLAADVLIRDFPGMPPFDGSVFTEPARSTIVAVPGAKVERLYENWNDPRWPDAVSLSRVSLLASLRAGTDFYLDVNRGSQSQMTAGLDFVSIADLAALNDAPRSTHAWITGAWCGDFSVDCLASAFVRGASGGAATCVAKSALGFIGEDQDYMMGYLNALYPPASKAAGQANALSKAPYFQRNFSSDRATIMSLNLIGDPGLHLRPISPAPRVVDFPAAIAVGSAGFDVGVSSAGAAIEGARVCAMLGEEAMAIAVTDAAGQAHLDLTPSHVGTEDLTVTASDGSYFEGMVRVESALAVGPTGESPTHLEIPEPNPAFASVRLAGSTAEGASLAIYDVSGRRLQAFAIAPGRFDLRWDLSDDDGRRVPAGLYFARLASRSVTRVQRLLVAR